MVGLPPLSDATVESLESLEIDSAKLTGWDGVYALQRLRSLEIGPKVKTLPDGIAGLASLERLIVRSKLKTLPADLARLPALTHLRIVDAAMTALPEELGALPLQELELNNTKKVKALPESLGTCATLRTLRTVAVPLKALPDGVWTLPDLFGPGLKRLYRGRLRCALGRRPGSLRSPFEPRLDVSSTIVRGHEPAPYHLSRGAGDALTPHGARAVAGARAAPSVTRGV